MFSRLALRAGKIISILYIFLIVYFVGKIVIQKLFPREVTRQSQITFLTLEFYSNIHAT